jgi:hypothetical protein
MRSLDYLIFIFISSNKKKHENNFSEDETKISGILENVSKKIGCKILPYLILFSFLSCQKNNDDKYSGTTIAEGYVVDNISGKALPYAKVYLMSEIGGWQPSNYGVYSYKIADSSGHFYFSFNASPDSFYAIDASARYYGHQVTDADMVTSGKKNLNMKIKLNPYGWVHFNLVNEPPLDTASIHIQGIGPSYTNYSQFLDTNYFAQGGGGINNGFWARIERKKDTFDLRDNIYIPPLDTISYIIKY